MSKTNQLTLFNPIADLQPKDQMDTMSYPVCSLTKSKRTKPIHFELEDKFGNTTSIHVSANEETGMAQIWDWDIMMYLATHLRSMRDQGVDMPIGEAIKFHGHDALIFTNRDTGSKGYNSLRQALARLNGTMVKTNLREKAKDEGEEKKGRGIQYNFYWISEWGEEYMERSRGDRKEKISKYFWVKLSDWFVNACWDDKAILTVNDDYFRLTGGLERYLYRLARKHCGKQKNGFRISLRNLHKRTGSTSTYKRFSQTLRQTIEKGNIPDYKFVLYSVEKNKVLYIQYTGEEAFKKRMNTIEEIASSPD